MKKIKSDFEEINLHGYKIQIFADKIKIYNDKNISFFDFKIISDQKVEYLMLEGFIPRKKIKVEVATLVKSDT